jgi:hypothetical protein
MRTAGETVTLGKLHAYRYDQAGNLTKTIGVSAFPGEIGIQIDFGRIWEGITK